MFKRHTEAEIDELKREYWLQSKARGKNRFIWREGVLPTLVTGFMGALVVEVFGDHSHSFSVSVRSIAFLALVLLPICLLGGYLTGRWRWKDFEKKYPENRLPPWE
jgi:hypothetical protein